MAKRKFNIKDIMSEESKSGAITSFEIENIPIKKIVPAPNNKYGIRDVEGLAASIEELGLLHNLVVKEADDNGLHEIISGERRYRACRLLFENGNGKFTRLPCKVEKASEDIMAELKIIHANAMARILTDAEKVCQAGRINEILYKLKNDGYEFKGRMRAAVAKILDVSAAQAGRMIKMDKDLADEVKEELNAGNIKITTAYELSSLDGKAQLEAVQELKETGHIDVEAYKRPKPSGNIPESSTKEQRKFKILFEKAGINLYNDDKSIRNPAELGQDIYRFLGLLD